ncbi:MAG: hypothetical protein ABSD59_01910 [Terracidiphilus sp.]|jgi:hypothetical protein
MATSNGGDSNPDSWPGFLSELTKSFLILRDIFGYAIPGAVFLSIGILCRRFSLSDVESFLRTNQDKIPAWLVAIFAVGACYTIGHLMAQIAYLLKNGWGLPWGRKTYGLTKPEADPENDGPDLFNVREDHPVLLTEYDRQTVMTQLRGSTGAAMLVGFLVFYVFPTPSIGVMAGFSGVFLLVVFLFSALPHMEELAKRTSKAGKTAMAADREQPTAISPQLKQVLEALIAAAQQALEKL